MKEKLKLLINEYETALNYAKLLKADNKLIELYEYTLKKLKEIIS